MRKLVYRGEIKGGAEKINYEYCQRVKLPLGFKEYLRMKIMEVRERRARKRLQSYLERTEGMEGEAYSNARYVVKRLLSSAKGDLQLIFAWCRTRNVKDVAKTFGCSRDKVYAALARL
ncbi:MAG: hypothetical protein MJ109_01660 [Kiritimatiellae bacterium]|nr:hypothetical protein [Kiritimatiellia bacterium]